ncbi:MAG: peptide chain release factor 2 [Spirochaetales bacterium]|nr:peptide chain release factor 2 [Spirochaetales bacterium]
MLQEIEPRIREIEKKILETWGIFDPDKLKAEILESEVKTSAEGFWNDRENAEKIFGELKRAKNRIEPWEEIKADLEELRELLLLAVEEADESLEAEINKGLDALINKYNKLEVIELLGEKFDANSAFITIHSGAGGTEACDWVNMLYRMYSRWMEREDFKYQILDLLEAEGGIKSVTVQVTGRFAYGYLKGESGVHRLVRISPFDSSSRRHTTFASVFISPVIDDDIEVDIKPDDIRIDTYRASGAGGQHVNKTDSAVRLTHLATGIVVQCQNERSQHKNKANAMKVLKSRLFEHYQAEQDKEHEKHALEKKEISWGNQIRSYVFHPYNMVKDHRTKCETGNVQAVMDGDLSKFIEDFLKWNWAENK